MHYNDSRCERSGITSSVLVWTACNTVIYYQNRTHFLFYSARCARSSAIMTSIVVWPFEPGSGIDMATRMRAHYSQRTWRPSVSFCLPIVLDRPAVRIITKQKMLWMVNTAFYFAAMDECIWFQRLLPTNPRHFDRGLVFLLHSIKFRFAFSFSYTCRQTSGPWLVREPSKCILIHIQLPHMWNYHITRLAQAKIKNGNK